MALKQKETYKGFDVEYWVITQLIYDKRGNCTDIVVDGYKDRPTRDEDLNNSIQDIQKRFTVDGNITLEQAYIALKTQPFGGSEYSGIEGKIPFETAEDV